MRQFFFRPTQIKLAEKFFGNQVKMNELLKGYKQFRDKYFQNPDNTLYKDLVVNGQQPPIMVIGCSDSRVDLSYIFNCPPGTFFTVRNVANLVPPCNNDLKHHGTSAAIEHGVKTLKVKHIIVFGHSHCGGIRHLLTSKTPSPLSETSFISSWMDIAREAKNKVLEKHKDQPLDHQAKICEEQSIIISLNNLKTFKWVMDKVSLGMLTLHGWRLDLDTGIIQQYNPSSNQFEDLPIEMPENIFSPSLHLR